MQLSNEEIRRYSRHLILPEVGMSGQKKICSTSVLCIGAGGLGSPIAMYLAAAGIGKLGLVDFDTVDFSNLQRQLLHGTEDVGRLKGESARDTIKSLNPNVEVALHNTRLTSDNALEIIRPYDIVVDGTDNFPTRYLTNDACVLLKKPNVYGSIFRFEGQASVFAPHLGGPCYRCLYPEPPPPGMVPSCAEGGVLGVLPGIIGCIQATEILKLALGRGTTLIGRCLCCEPKCSIFQRNSFQGEGRRRIRTWRFRLGRLQKLFERFLNGGQIAGPIYFLDDLNLRGYESDFMDLWFSKEETSQIVANTELRHL